MIFVGTLCHLMSEARSIDKELNFFLSADISAEFTTDEIRDVMKMSQMTLVFSRSRVILISGNFSMAVIRVRCDLHVR